MVQYMINKSTWPRGQMGTCLMSLDSTSSTERFNLCMSGTAGQVIEAKSEARQSKIKASELLTWVRVLGIGSTMQEMVFTS